MWSRLCDTFYDNPKVVKAGLAGAGLFASSLSYSARHLTDGVIEAEIAEVLSRGDAALRDRLVAVGLWEVDGPNYRIHDWNEYNPSAEQVKLERRRDSDRKRKARGVLSESERTPSGIQESRPRARDGTGRDGSGSSESPEEVETDAPILGGDQVAIIVEGHAPVAARGRIDIGIFDRKVPVPWGADWKVTPQQNREWRAHGCGNPAVAFQDFRAYFAALAGEPHRGWHARWDLVLYRWMLKHPQYGCPCQRRQTPLEKQRSGEENARHRKAAMRAPTTRTVPSEPVQVPGDEPTGSVADLALAIGTIGRPIPTKTPTAALTAEQEEARRALLADQVRSLRREVAS